MNNPKNRRGQAAIEMILTLPLLIIITLAIVQMTIVQDRSEKCQASTWFAMRGQTFDFHTKNVDEASMALVLQNDVFGPKDQVTISHEISWSFLSIFSALSPLNAAKEVKSTVQCSVPYLYPGLKWMDQIFINAVGGDERIVVQATNQMSGAALNASSNRSVNP